MDSTTGSDIFCNCSDGCVCDLAVFLKEKGVEIEVDDKKEQICQHLDEMLNTLGRDWERSQLGSSRYALILICYPSIHYFII